ncbi:hypothetical protein BC830DRAFT_1094918 [Chytriomyces sp. MP71]|nr:hypothetical protein BC830DRAFT_1094918 [Chytriomyces sp. MP71]
MGSPGRTGPGADWRRAGLSVSAGRDVAIAASIAMELPGSGGLSKGVIGSFVSPKGNKKRVELQMVALSHVIR